MPNCGSSSLCLCGQHVDRYGVHLVAYEMASRTGRTPVRGKGWNSVTSQKRKRTGVWRLNNTLTPLTLTAMDADASKLCLSRHPAVATHHMHQGACLSRHPAVDTHHKHHIARALHMGRPALQKGAWPSCSGPHHPCQERRVQRMPRLSLHSQKPHGAPPQTTCPAKAIGAKVKQWRLARPTKSKTRHCFKCKCEFTPDQVNICSRYSTSNACCLRFIDASLPTHDNKLEYGGLLPGEAKLQVAAKVYRDGGATRTGPVLPLEMPPLDDKDDLGPQVARVACSIIVESIGKRHQPMGRPHQVRCQHLKACAKQRQACDCRQQPVSMPRAATVQSEV